MKGILIGLHRRGGACPSRSLTMTALLGIFKKVKFSKETNDQKIVTQREGQAPPLRSKNNINDILSQNFEGYNDLLGEFGPDR